MHQMLESKTHNVSYTELPDDTLPHSITSEATSASADDSNVLVPEPEPQPRVTFADRVRISSGVRLGNRASPQAAQNSRKRSKPSSPRERLLYAAEHGGSFVEGFTISPSPSRSRSSSVSDSASSMSVPLRPPSLVTPHAYATSYNPRPPIRPPGSSLTTIMSSSDANTFLSSLRGSIKRPQKQHAARPANLDADLAASTQQNADEVSSSADDYASEDAEPNETTPLRAKVPSRRNRQTLRSVARRYGRSGNEDDGGNDDGFWLPCVSLRVSFCILATTFMLHMLKILILNV